jgi:hypothetical protein
VIKTANKRQMIIDRLWIMKKAAQEIDAICMAGIDCDTMCPAKGLLPECTRDAGSIADMKIPEE